MSDPGKRLATLQMASEALREGGILVGIFGFLEGSLRDTPPGWHWYAAVGVLSMLMLAAGIVAERTRP